MTQKEKLLSILTDGRPHSNLEIHEKTGMLRYAARIMELKAQGFEIKSWHDEEDRQKYWYQLKAVGSTANSQRECVPIVVASANRPVFNQELFNFNRPSAGHWDF